MKVSFIGFSIQCNPLISLDELISNIIINSDNKYKINTFERLLFCNKNFDDDYYLGVLITIKDQKSFYKLESDGSNLRIIINQIDEKDKLLDFNFFIINKKTGTGLYQYYHHSCIANRFGYLLSNIYDAIKRDAIKNGINKINDGDDNEKSKKLFRKSLKDEYKFKLGWSILINPEELGTLLNHFERIKSLEFNYQEIRAEEDPFRPLGQFIKTQKTKFIFVEAKIAELTSAIINTLDKANILSGIIHVEDQAGQDYPIDIMDNPSNFGKYDYEEVTTHLKSLDLKTFENSWVIQELLRVAKKNKKIFEERLQT